MESGIRKLTFSPLLSTHKIGDQILKPIWERKKNHISMILFDNRKSSRGKKMEAVSLRPSKFHVSVCGH